MINYEELRLGGSLKSEYTLSLLLCNNIVILRVAILDNLPTKQTSKDHRDQVLKLAW